MKTRIRRLTRNRARTQLHTGHAITQRCGNEVETLEERCLLSITSMFSAGALTILAEASDAVVLNVVDGNVTINDVAASTGRFEHVTPADVQSLTVNGGANGSVIDLRNVTEQHGFVGLNGQIFINGGDGADSIVGSGFVDIINAGDGDDTINGRAGDDQIIAGAGQDVIE